MKAPQIRDILDEDQVNNTEHDPTFLTHHANEETEARSVAFRVQTRQSPYVDVFHGHQTSRIIIDSGATGNVIRQSTAKHLGAKIAPSSQAVHQADGSSPFKVVGETHVTFTRDNQTFQFEGLVIEELDVEVLVGPPFMETNDVVVWLAGKEVTLGDGSNYSYGSPAHPDENPTACYAFQLRAPDHRLSGPASSLT